MKSNTSKRKQVQGIHEGSERKAQAWYDSDDEISDVKGLEARYPNRGGKPDALYRQRLVEGFQLVHGIPAWSVKSKKQRMSESEVNEVVVEFELVEAHEPSSSLSPGQLNIVKVLNLNNTGNNEKEYIRSIEFHPTSQVALVADSGSVVNLHQVDGVTNAKVMTVYYDDFPVRCATFAADGLEYYVTSPSRKYFCSYDMMSGRIAKLTPSFSTRHETIRKIVSSPDNKVLVCLGHHGHMYLHTRSSKERIGTLKINGEVQDIVFNSAGTRMFCTGTLGEIFEWDMVNRACVARFPDEGAIVGSTIAVTPSFLATGSSSGVVNIYDRETISQAAPKPLKSLMNLTTRVTSLEANHSGELLAFGSYEKRDVIKLAHLPSMSVYSNFPYMDTYWGRPNTMAFSPNSGYFSFGNDRGEAYLFRLEHFENY